MSSDPRSRIPDTASRRPWTGPQARSRSEGDRAYYQLHQADGTAARAGVLKDIQHDHPQLYKWIQEGQYILLNGDPGQSATAVIAYEKDAPTQGGVVLTCDFTPQRMTAQEFQAAPKAGQP